MGNSSSWGGQLVMAHDVMKDAIDVEAARRALAQVSRGRAVQGCRAAGLCRAHHDCHDRHMQASGGRSVFG